MKCHVEGCDKEVEHQEREEWYGMCDEHAEENQKLTALIN